MYSKFIAILIVAGVAGFASAGMLLTSNQAEGKVIYVPSECKEYVEQAVNEARGDGATTVRTVTTTVTVATATETNYEGGLPSEVTYAAVAIAVIAIAAAAVLAMRKQ